MELLEREDQLRTLEEAWSAAAKGAGRVVLVSGEAGIGKTSLVREFTARHTGRSPAYWGACDALFTPRPLGPFIDIAEHIGGGLLQLVQSSPNWYEAGAALLRQLNPYSTSVILIIEDIHWADEATLDLLKFLGRRVENTRLLLILTFRDDERAAQDLLAGLTGDLRPASTVRVALSPLSQASVDVLAQRAHREPAGVFAATAGNPLFVTVMLESDPGVVPSSVRDLVLARTSRLSAVARQAAELTALIPGGAELWLLERILDDPAQAIDECVQGGVLRADSDKLQFRHELARRAVEDAVAPGSARRLHTLLLQALERDGAEGLALARIVHHAAHAGDFAALLRYAPEAARQASRLGAHRQAAALYQLVLTRLVSLTPQQRAELLEGRSFECYLTGEIAAALQARLQAGVIWKSLGDREREGDNLRWLSRLTWFMGKRQDAERYAAEAVEILASLPPGRPLAMAYSNMAQLFMLIEDYDRAPTWAEQAVALAARLDATPIMVHALTTLGTLELRAGNEQGRTKLVQALTLARENGLHDDAGRAYANLVAPTLRGRRYADAQTWLTEGLAYTDEFQLDSYFTYLLSWHARLHLEMGRWDLAEACATRAMASDRGASVSALPALIALAHLKARRGSRDADAWLARARAAAEATGELQRLGPAAAALAEHAWWQHKPEQVAEAASLAYELALRLSDEWIAGEIAYWLWRAGKRGFPLDRLAQPYRFMIEGQWEAAAETWATIGCPFERGLALSGGGFEAQLQALQVFEQMGAQPAAEMLRDQLRRQGVKGVPRGPRPETRQNPAGLTAREIEVLALLSDGLSNAAIAEQLSIAKKTCDHHVSAILSKLDARTRSEAVAAARRHRLIS